LEVDENCYLVETSESDNGLSADALGASETAIEETNWLLLKARSKLQNVFGIKRDDDAGELNDMEGVSVYDKDEKTLNSYGFIELKEILGEIKKKEMAVKMIIAEQGRLEASVELCELHQQSLKLMLAGLEKSEDGGLVAVYNGIGNVEKAVHGLLRSLVFEGEEDENGVLEIGGGGGGGANNNNSNMNPLATLLTTVFNPRNLTLN